MVVEFLCAGKTLRDVARKVGLSDSTMQSYRRKIAVKIVEYMVADVLVDAATYRSGGSIWTANGNRSRAEMTAGRVRRRRNLLGNYRARKCLQLRTRQPALAEKQNSANWHRFGLGWRGKTSTPGFNQSPGDLTKGKMNAKIVGCIVGLGRFDPGRA